METIEELETRLLSLGSNASIDNEVGRIEIHRRLAELYEAQGAFASALAHYKQYHSLEKARGASPFLPHATSEDFQPPDRRLAEALRRSRIKTRELYQVSRNLNAAQSEQALLEVLARPALERGAFRAILVYMTLNSDNNPEWLKIAATVMGGADPQPSSDESDYLPSLSFRHLWLPTPSRPQLIRDIRYDHRVDEQTRQIYQDWGVQALAILPLMYGGHWVGLIVFHWDQPHPFSEDERGIYTTLIGLAAPAVHSRRLLVEQERALVNKLYQISRGLNAARDKDELLATFTEPLMEPGKIDRALLGRIETTRDGEPGWLEFVAGRSAGERLPPPSLRLHLPDYPGAQLWLESPHHPVLVADVSSDPRMSQNGRELMAQSGIMSLAIVPLRQSNRWVGVLFFHWFQPHMFSEQEAEIFQALPAMVTPAVDNLWLMEILERLVATRTAQLQESEERLREVVEGTNDLIAQLDLDGRFLYLNHTAEKILGQKVKRCLGSPLLEFVYPEDQERTGRLLNDWRSTSASYMTLENRLVNRQTGQLYSMDWSINLHRDPTGQLTHFSAIGHDITGRKEAEEAIRLVNTELRQRVEELVTLNRITQTLATLTSLPVALKFVAWELVNLLGGNGALVGLLDEARSALQVVAHHSQYSEESLVGRIFPLDVYPFSTQVIETGRVVVVTDAQNHSTREADWKVIRSRGIHAIIGLPLLARGEIMGVVSVSSIIPDRTFTADEIRLAETVAGQIAGAIANAQLFEEEKRQRLENARLFEAEHAALERAETLHAVSLALSSTLELSEVLDLILIELRKVVPYDSASIHKFDGQRFEVIAGTGFPLSPLGLRLEVEGNEVMQTLVQTLAPLVLDDVSDYPEFQMEPFDTFKIRAWIGVPLLVGNRMIGSIGIDKHQSGFYTSEHGWLAMAFATQAAIALENARLFEAEHIALERAETLYAVSLALSAALELTDVLDLILTELWRVVPYDSASVHQFDGQTFEVIAATGFPVSVLGVTTSIEINSLMQKVAQTHAPLVIEDVGGYPEFQLEPHAAFNIHSWIGVPLLVGDRLIGSIGVDKHEAGFYTQEHGRLAMAFATQAAIALENARLFEEAAQARKAAEVANRAKSTFLATMSHEFRTPLNVILGYAQLLRREPGLTEPLHEALNIIQQSGEHLLTLINDVLDLSRIEAGKLQLDTLDFHLPTFLRKVSDMIRVSAETKGLSFYLVSGALPDFIQADERRLRQILINLLSNAVKFTNKGQVILRVGVHRKESGNREPKAPSLVPIRFEVEDTGIGIAPENLKTIFDPFQQSKDYIRKTQGTGLGLSICRNLVELMGGSLQIESKVGQGSLFWFQLSLPEAQIGAMDKRLDLSEADPVVTWAPRGPSTISGDAKGRPLSPSSEELAILIELARLGDIANLRRQAEGLKAQNRQLAPFVTELERLVKTFQLDIIQSWLKSYQQAKEDRR
jgi:PAS domain S-box-containing protein